MPQKLVEELVKEGIDGTSLLKGDATRTFDMLTPDTEYLLFAFGYDAESQQAFTSLSRKVFKSARELSELTVEITVEDITPETAQVAFIPSDKTPPISIRSSRLTNSRGSRTRSSSPGP